MYANKLKIHRLNVLEVNRALLKRAGAKPFFKDLARFATLLRKAVTEKNAPRNSLNSNNPLAPSQTHLPCPFQKASAFPSRFHLP